MAPTIPASRIPHTRVRSGAMGALAVQPHAAASASRDKSPRGRFQTGVPMNLKIRAAVVVSATPGKIHCNPLGGRLRSDRAAVFGEFDQPILRHRVQRA